MAKKQRSAVEAAENAMADAAQVEHDMAIDRERRKYSALRSKYRTATRQLEVAEAELAAALGIGTPRPRKVRKPRPDGKGSACAVIMLSDWHTEETVEPEVIHGLNEYNLDVFERRCDRAFTGAIRQLEVARGNSDIDEVVVAVLGDLINGNIHEELVEGNQLGPAPAVLHVRDKLAGGIEYLVDTIDNVERFRVVCCFGNHGRFTKKPRKATARETNLEWLLYRMMQSWADDHFDGLEWEVADGNLHYAIIKGRNTRVMHGDWVRYNGGVGGPTIPLNKAIAKWDKDDRTKADINLMGHWHEFMRPEATTIVNGSLVGFNAYAESIKATPSEPSQTLVVIDRDRRQKVVFAEEIFVED